MSLTLFDNVIPQNARILRTLTSKLESRVKSHDINTKYHPLKIKLRFFSLFNEE
jgi:hypothetical protein